MWGSGQVDGLERHRARAVDTGEAVVTSDERHGLTQRRAHHVAAHRHAHGAKDQALLDVEHLGKRLQGASMLPGVQSSTASSAVLAASSTAPMPSLARPLATDFSSYSSVSAS